MENLIKALQIFLKYGNPDYPTNCVHDELQINIEIELVSEEDLVSLESLSFRPNEFGCFSSTKYGSC